MRKKIYLIEGCNFIDYPSGGQLSFCTQLLDAFPDNYFKLIGISTNHLEPIGRWQKKIINNKEYEFYPLLFSNTYSAKGIIPKRLRFFFALYKYKRKIFFKENFYHIFTHAPETLLALDINSVNIKVLHFMHGIENPLLMPRFKWGILFSGIFWKLYLKKLNRCDYIAAASDSLNIEQFKKKNNFNKRIDFFPTRFDNNIFKPSYEKKLELPTFIFCGRINYVKGWEFLIDSFDYYLKNYGEAKLILIGDGEDRKNLEKKNENLFIKDKVTLTGFLKKHEIAKLLNLAHIFILPSFKEGWPISLLEALGCGLPVVATAVSGVKDLIINGENGYMVTERNVVNFSSAMHRALKLDSPNKISLGISKKYYLSSFKEDLIKFYPDFFNFNEK